MAILQPAKPFRAKNAEIYFCHLNLSAQPDDKAFDNTKDK
tara:strand:- start:32761 stop:32880 length:120 start_codon:yes stop_codon:yes gene_type:complete